MKCPCCDNKMKKKSKYVEQPILDFSGTSDYDFETVLSTQYKCKDCDIKYKDGVWNIPEKYERPTEKQIATIYFINNMLNTDIEPLLKVQCQREISKHLAEAQETKRIRDEEFANDYVEMYGDIYYF